MCQAEIDNSILMHNGVICIKVHREKNKTNKHL